MPVADRISSLIFAHRCIHRGTDVAREDTAGEQPHRRPKRHTVQYNEAVLRHACGQDACRGCDGSTDEPETEPVYEPT